MFYEVIPGKVFGKGDILTYESDDYLSIGQIVEIPLGRGKAVGIINKKVAQPNFSTKGISKVFYSKPLPAHLLATARFVADYYKVPLANTLGLILPSGVEKKRRGSKKTEQMFGIPLMTGPAEASNSGPCPSGPFAFGNSRPTGRAPRTDGTNSRAAALRNTHSSGCLRHPSLAKTEHLAKLPQIPLNQAQKNALQSLQKAAGATKLLYGVTGSGKTNIYLEMAKNALLRQKSTILLVPEIALTGQLVRVFGEIFGERVVLIHSKQTEAERHLIFEDLLNAKESKIVIGPRSALFAPLDDLGLIIIDEEHESTYHQENAPKYSAIRVASFMAGNLGIDLILGSATPTVEDFYLAKQKDTLTILTEKAKTTAIRPDIKVVDFKNRDNFSKNRYFANSLIAAIKNNLEQGQQTLIFHNRRGSAPLTICESCGEEIVCPNCYLPLTLHADTYELTCHTCGYKEKVPMNCPKCGAPGIIHKGFGTKLLESELKKLFKEARIKRFDADSKKGEGLDEIYDEVKAGGVDILVGTQTLAKGLDLPKLATVGVVQADAGLNLPDFMAEERTFQLLTQVIGRVGRGHIETAQVFVQTFRPEAPVIDFAITEDYLGFYEYMIKKRRKAGFPPFCFVAKAEIAMKTEAIVLKKVRLAVNSLRQDKRLIVSPPIPAFHERTARGYNWQIIIRAKSRKTLMEACSGLDPSFRVTFDPPGLL